MSFSEGVESEDLSFPEEEDALDPIGLYIGERNAAGQRHGRGWAILTNGDQYDGQYRQGRRHGIGLYVFKGGARYYGKYRCGHRAGRGIFIYPNGTMYEGNWRKSMKHGKGRYQYANGDTYSGDWYHGHRHGVGVYTFAASEGCPALRFKGTWRHGVRDGPFELYFGDDDKCVVLHGTWDNLYPQGPAVFTFDQQYMLTGFFQTRNALLEKRGMGEMEEAEENHSGDLMLEVPPPMWFAQDVSVYDYSQLPQEPVPLPLSDSDISICSLSTVPTEMLPEPSVQDMVEGEMEGLKEEEEACICEGEMSDIETDSQPCTENADPCDIDVSKPLKC